MKTIVNEISYKLALITGKYSKNNYTIVNTKEIIPPKLTIQLARHKAITTFINFVKTIISSKKMTVQGK